VTFARWLAFQCSLLPQVAREHERIGKRLAELPLLLAASARGELSHGKVSVLVRVAEPGTEAHLPELADVLTASQLARCVAAYRRVSAAEAADRQEREFLDCFWSEEGWLVLRGRLAAEQGALFLRALEAARDALSERRRASNVEALAALAELALAPPEGERSGGERYQVVVHVDAATLAADRAGRCELADGRPLAVETGRRLACDASLVELDDRGCRFPGLCAEPRCRCPPRAALEQRRPPPASPAALRDHHRCEGLAIDAATSRNGSSDRMDLGLAVDAIISIAG
jgi:hypothetical protein